MVRYIHFVLLLLSSSFLYSLAVESADSFGVAFVLLLAYDTTHGPSNEHSS